jgi:cytochrome P450
VRELSTIDLSEHLIYGFWPRSRSQSDQMTEVGSWNGVLVAIAVATAALLLLVVRIRKPRRRLPPGPPGWPIIGNLLSLGTEPHRALEELSKKYGPLMLIRLGSIKTVVVSSPDMAAEIFKKNDQIMSSRPSMLVTDQIFYGHPVPLDIAWSTYGQQWRYVRKICTIGLLTTARINQFREIREQEVLASLHFMLEESKQGNAVNIGECFSITTANNITQMLMKKSYCIRSSSSNKSAVSDGMSAWFHDAFQELFVLLGTINISDCVPFLKPFDIQGLQKRTKVLHEKLDDFFQKILDERRQNLTTVTPGKEDFVDALLGFGKTKEFQERLSEEAIKSILLDMVAAASDTSSVTAQWALTELMRHPNVMRTVHEELDSLGARG